MMSRLLALVPPTHAGLVRQFLRFGVVGVFGFLVDTAVVYSTRATLGLYAAGALSYLAAASGNWAINRAWTFRGAAHRPMHRQWALFLTANLAGFVLNRGAYAILVTVSPFCAANPVLATAAGAVSGMFLNFTVSRRIVFR